MTALILFELNIITLFKYVKWSELKLRWKRDNNKKWQVTGLSWDKKSYEETESLILDPII